MVWQVGGLGAELMINIVIVSIHAILYIDILGFTFVMGGRPCPPPHPRSTTYALSYIIFYVMLQVYQYSYRYSVMLQVPQCFVIMTFRTQLACCQ